MKQRQPHVRPDPRYFPPAEPESESLALLLLAGASIVLLCILAFVLLPVLVL